MNALIQHISAAAEISPEQAAIAIQITLNSIKDQLPASLAAHIDSILDELLVASPVV